MEPPLQKEEIPDEEMAYKLVELYVREVSQRGERRQMGLDTIINAYFYTLLRLRKKRKEMGLLEEAVVKEETQLAQGVENIFFPEPSKKQFDFD